MSISNIGAIAGNFKKSRSGTWIGLATRRYQSGEVHYDRSISQCGDRHLRRLLYQAYRPYRAHLSAEFVARRGELRERIGCKRAAV